MDVVVYKSKRMPDTYLYMAKDGSIEEVPDGLLAKFTDPQIFLEFELTKERHLEQADPAKVIESINESGYYLQLPPSEQVDVLAN